jgi:RecA/RadA recombinase
MSDEVEEVKAALRKPKRPTSTKTSRLLSSGSTLLNLACTGTTKGAYPKGDYIFFVGDSDSGKTWYCMSMLAEAATNARFDDYRFIYDPTEGGAQMDIAYYFGQAVADRLEAPVEGAEPMSAASEHLEGFYINLDRALDHEKPCIYILDSMDALNPIEADEKFDADRKQIESGKEASGSFGTAKAKLNSQHLRRIIPKLRKTGSILIIIAQTRDNIGFGAQFNPKTRAGGKALEFYADMQIWTSPKGPIYKTVRGKKRAVGNQSICKVKRSRVTGRRAEVVVPFYHEYGIDDVSSMIDYLIEEGHWAKNKQGRVDAKDFEFQGTETKLIEHIENNELVTDLRGIVGTVWSDIIEQSKLKRKPRYE